MPKVALLLLALLVVGVGPAALAQDPNQQPIQTATYTYEMMHLRMENQAGGSLPGSRASCPWSTSRRVRRSSAARNQCLDQGDQHRRDRARLPARTLRRRPRHRASRAVRAAGPRRHRVDAARPGCPVRGSHQLLHPAGHQPDGRSARSPASGHPRHRTTTASPTAARTSALQAPRQATRSANGASTARSTATSSWTAKNSAGRWAT